MFLKSVSAVMISNRLNASQGLAMFKKRSELVGSGSRYCVRDDLHLELAVEHCVHPMLEAAPLAAGAPLVPTSQVTDKKLILYRFLFTFFLLIKSCTPSHGFYRDIFCHVI